METWLPLIIQIVAGAIVGNLVGSAMKGRSLGSTGNSLAGAVGGGLVGQVLNLLGLGAVAPGTGLDLASILTAVLGGGAGGGVVASLLAALRGGTART